MKTFVEKYIATERKSELDLLFPYYDGEEPNEVMIPNHKIPYSEAPSMPIDEAIQILNTLKEMGANRVYIADHQDHQGYYFHGVKLIEI